MSRVAKAVLWMVIASLCIGLVGPWQKALESWLRTGSAVASVNGHLITQESLATAMQKRLWRRGESWDSLTREAADELRQQTLNHLIDCQLLPQPTTSATAQADEELRWFQGQLAFETTRYSSALAGQHLTEAELHDRMEQQLQAGAALEALTASSVDDATARVWFDQHRHDMNLPRVWHVAHLFLSNHDPAKPDRTEEIQRLSTMLISGLATFDELVAQHSEDERTKAKRGDLGWFGSSRMPADFIKAVESLRPGAVSPPIKTKLGWHLLKLIDSKNARDLTFEEVREEITCHLQAEQRQRSLEGILSKLRSTAVIQRHEAIINATTPTP